MPLKKSFFLTKIENTILHFPIKHTLDLTPNTAGEDLRRDDVPFPYDPSITMSMHADFEHNAASSNTYSFIAGHPHSHQNHSRPSPSTKNITIVPLLPTFTAASAETRALPATTDVCCYWDTEPFDTQPLGLPEKKVGGTFYVKHCFCSFNCMASYNFELKDTNVWERYMLINLMNQTMYNLNQNVRVELALPREALTKFGGKYNIVQFRNLYKEKCIKVMSYPIIHIQTYLEENQLSTDSHHQHQQQLLLSNNNNNNNNNDTNSSSSDVKQYLNKINDKYNLARTKETTHSSRNTLEFCMGLKNV